ncbi:hypothetical protein ACQPZ2_20405 [Nocardia pseudovaccinii]|uniref:hypothetical protein n=1 Tax=Nocardia pseudovaccinii TaxID=189540 RepID=UPI003D910BF6
MTIVRRVGGRTDDGGSFDGYEQFHPGDPGYDELLAAATANRAEADADEVDDPAESAIDPDTLARILRETGLDAADLDDR